MRYWNVQAAAKDLAAGDISEWGKAKYLIFGSVLSIILTTLPFWIFGYTINTPTMIGYVISIAVVIIGFIRLYRINETIDSSGFIERYVIFALPAAIKVTTLYWVAYFSLIISFTVAGYANSPVWLLIGVISSPIYYVAFFWVMSHGFKAYVA